MGEYCLNSDSMLVVPKVLVPMQGIGRGNTNVCLVQRKSIGEVHRQPKNFDALEEK